MKLFPLLFLILLIIIKIDQFGAAKKKHQQKTFNEIFGEKWEEKEEKQKNELKKREIIGKYYKLKEKIKQKGKKYSTKEWSKINSKIAKKLRTNRTYIQKWIKQLGLNQEIQKSHESKTDEEKFKIVQKFIEIKNEYKQKRKYSSEEWKQNYAEICKKIGVSQFTIDKWKKQFGVSNKRITDDEKIEKVKKYWKTKKENPKMSEREIAKMLKIDRSSISTWKKQFGEEILEDLNG